MKLQKKICVGGFICAALMFSSVSYAANKAVEEISALQNKTYNLTFADEKLALDCRDNKKEAISNDLDKVRDVLGEYVKSAYQIGKVISPITFCDVLAFDQWNNKLQSSGASACSNVKTEQEIYPIKKKILSDLNQDQLRLNKEKQSNYTNLRLQKYDVALCEPQK